ncbi:MAG TPA: DUF4142 domain-containing protein [Allosphingosinicella sp.]|nr:DUF4142 domain-containing protein [Allosphingosinicella sp.]
MRKKMLAAALLALAACGGDKEKTGNDAAAPASQAKAPAPAPEAKLPNSAQEYADMASASDLYEVESARLASEKSRNPEVQALARMIIEDHEQSAERLKAAAAAARPPVTVTPDMDTEQRFDVQALRVANGDQFDKAFIAQQVKAHRKALRMALHYSAKGEAPPLKQHAAEAVQPMRRHLEQAEKLAQAR